MEGSYKVVNTYISKRQLLRENFPIASNILVTQPSIDLRK